MFWILIFHILKHSNVHTFHFLPPAILFKWMLMEMKNKIALFQLAFDIYKCFFPFIVHKFKNACHKLNGTLCWCSTKHHMAVFESSLLSLVVTRRILKKKTQNTLLFRIASSKFAFPLNTLKSCFCSFLNF